MSSCYQSRHRANSSIVFFLSVCNADNDTISSGRSFQTRARATGNASRPPKENEFHGPPTPIKDAVVCLCRWRGDVRMMAPVRRDTRKLAPGAGSRSYCENAAGAIHASMALRDRSKILTFSSHCTPSLHFNVCANYRHKTASQWCFDRSTHANHSVLTVPLYYATFVLLIVSAHSLTYNMSSYYQITPKHFYLNLLLGSTASDSVFWLILCAL